MPKLETVIRDARHVPSTLTTNQTMSMDIPTPPPCLKDDIVTDILTHT